MSYKAILFNAALRTPQPTEGYNKFKTRQMILKSALK